MLYGIALGFPQNLNPAPNMHTHQELVEIDFVINHLYGLMAGWWFGTWLDYDFPFSWECHHHHHHHHHPN